MSDPDNGVIKVHPGVWAESATPVKSGHEAAQDITNTVVVALNGLMEALGGLAFVSGATNLASAVENFGDSIGRSLGCVAVDMAVISSGLQVAAKTFAATDAALTALFQKLSEQMPAYTTTSAVSLSPTVKYTPYVAPKKASSGGGFSLGHLWHSTTHVTSSVAKHVGHDASNWGHDAGNAVNNALSDVGVPSTGSQYAGDIVAGTVAGGIVILGVVAAAG